MMGEIQAQGRYAYRAAGKAMQKGGVGGLCGENRQEIDHFLTFGFYDILRLEDDLLIVPS